jgi:exosortase/archaeosortase family protein
MNIKYRFVILSMFMFLSWLIAEKYVLYSPMFIDYSLFVNHLILKALIYPAKWILDLTGLDTEINYNIIKITGNRGIRITNECLGINLFVVFTILPLVYPASAKSKLIFIPFGLMLIHSLNIIRIVVLNITQLINHDRITYEYHNSFNFIIYIIILILWYYFFKKIIM